MVPKVNTNNNENKVNLNDIHNNSKLQSNSNNAIYSDISDVSFKSSSNNEIEKKFSYIDEIKRKKIKEALDRISKKTKEINPRFRSSIQSHFWPNGTTLVVGDSILQGIKENKLKKYNIKVRCFPGCQIDDLYDYVRPLLKKNPTNLIIHCGTNDASTKTAGQIINELKNLQVFIEEQNPVINVYFSSPTLRVDNLNLNKKLSKVSEYLEQNFKLFVMSKNIDRTCLGRKGLHLNLKGSGRFASNLITLMKCL